MEAVKILRQLWERRVLVSVGLALATVAGIVMAYSVHLGLPPRFDARQYKVGIASAGVLVDSPSSLSIDLSGGQSKADVASLSARARLLANLMATSPLKDQIARRAGVSPDRVIATAPTDGPALKPSPLTTGETKVKASDPDANILTVYVNEVLPIITADAQAATPELAARISSAAVEELTMYLQTVAATDKVPDARQLVIKPLGPAKSATVQRGPRKLFAFVVFLFVLGLWCAGILLVAGLARNWRAADAADAREPSGPAHVASRTATFAAQPDPVPDSEAPPSERVRRRPQRTVPDSLPEHPERPERPRRVA